MQLRVIGLATIVATAISCASTGGQNDINEVWAREDAYWRYVQAGDVDGYLSLWHPAFRGWPCAANAPATTATIGDWVRNIRDQKIRFTYDLHREGSTHLDKTVVVYYRTTMVSEFPDGHVVGRGDVRKFTHTWIRDGSTWKILGGMCGDIAPLSANVVPPTAQDEVIAVNLERLHALASGDMQRLEQIFSDDFVYVTATGKIETKDDFRKSIAGGYKLAFVEPEGLRVRMQGTTAVVTYTTHRDMPAGQPAVESISTCVYVRDPQAGWQLVSQQTNRVSR